MFGKLPHQLALRVFARQLRRVKATQRAGTVGSGPLAHLSDGRLFRPRPGSLLGGQLPHRARHLEGSDHDIAEVAVPRGLPAVGADLGDLDPADGVFARRLAGGWLPHRRRARCLNQFFQVAVGEFDLRRGPDQAHGKQAGNARRNQRPEQVGAPHVRSAFCGALGRVAFLGHEVENPFQTGCRRMSGWN